jgi:two-component system response regulator VicR
MGEKKMKIMLADDDESIRMVVEHIVKQDGFDFCFACDGAEALEIFLTEQPDLLILDVMMPGINGFDVCADLRKQGNNIPIIFLSAKGDIVDKSVGFKLGADDYLVKPFSSLELSLRIEALLRRCNPEQEENIPESKEIIKTGDLEIYLNLYEVKLSGKHVDLTAKEFEILSYMAQCPRKIFTRKQLLDHIWGEDNYIDLNSITVFVRRIREKIEEDPSKPKYLQTVWRVGYKFCTE